MAIFQKLEKIQKLSFWEILQGYWVLINFNGLSLYCPHWYLSFGTKITSLSYCIGTLQAKTDEKFHQKWGQRWLFEIFAFTTHLYCYIHVSNVFYSMRRGIRDKVWGISWLLCTFTLVQASLASILASKKLKIMFYWIWSIKTVSIGPNVVYECCTHWYLSFGTKNTSLSYCIGTLQAKTDKKFHQCTCL